MCSVLATGTLDLNLTPLPPLVPRSVGAIIWKEQLWAVRVARVIECLPDKKETLSSIPSTKEGKEGREGRREEGRGGKGRGRGGEEGRKDF
jgi:hypothetical protein